MRWTVHGERTVYDSEWMRVALVDVEVPGGPRFEHHVLRAPSQAAGTVVHDDDGRVLMLWRHRFVTDTWGWEIPAGPVAPGEEPEAAAIRETIEETGWRPGQVTHLVSYRPSIGVSDQQFHIFLAGSALQVGDPTDPGEAERVEWVPIDRVRRLMTHGEIKEGMSLTGLLYAISFGPLGPT